MRETRAQLKVLFLYWILIFYIVITSLQTALLTL